jgi:macrolide transport system ATP-binding/permease protein
MRSILDRIRRIRIDDELAREIDAHIAERVDDLVDAGLSLKEARQQARREFGNIARHLEDSREVWSPLWLQQLLQDMRYALRTFRRNPLFTLVVVLSLALGIGANTTIFSLIDAVMWKSLPVKDPQGLWVARFVQPASARGFLFKYSSIGNDYFFNYGQFRRMREDSGTANIGEVAAYSAVRLNVSVEGEMEPAAEGLRVSGNYFSLLGVEPVEGRAINLDDDRVPEGRAVAVLSYDYWQRRFKGDRNTIGSTIALSGAPFKIIGVAPPNFFGLDVGTPTDIFVPVAMQPVVTPVATSGVEGSGTGRAWLQLVARLKPGVDPKQATTALQAAYSNGATNRANADRRMELMSASSGISGLRLQFSAALFLLMGVVGIVLLIACANIANLMLARGASRRPEFTMRIALGAGRWRIVRQLLVESLLLAVVGGVCGVLLAQWATRFLVLFMSAGRTPIVLDLGLDFRVLAFTAVVSVFTAILFGLVPALRATTIDFTPPLKSNWSSKWRGRFTLTPGKILAVGQVALSLVLLVSAGLFLRSFQNLNSQDAGFPRDSVVVVRVEPKGSNQRSRNVAQRLDESYTQLLGRVRAIEGVRSASMGNVSPLKPDSGAGAGSIQSIPVSAQAVYPFYFDTLGQPLLAGRDFNDTDVLPESERVCIVNESFRRLAFGGEPAEAIGKPCPTTGGAREGARAIPRIIGVVKDSRYTHLRSAPQPVVYQPFLQANTVRGQMILFVRLNCHADLVTAPIRDEVWKLDRHVPQFEVRTLAQEMNAALVPDRLIAMLSTFFGGLALLLSSVGLYGLFAFAVVQRTSELGIRMALGTTRASVVWMVLREALSLVVLGILIGLLTILIAGRLAGDSISGMLYGLDVLDPVTIIGATLFLAAVAALAAYFPARRASRVEPSVALRNE